MQLSLKQKIRWPLKDGSCVRDEFYLCKLFAFPIEHETIYHFSKKTLFYIRIISWVKTHLKPISQQTNEIKLHLIDSLSD